MGKIKRELLKEKRQRPQREDPLISVGADITDETPCGIEDNTEHPEHELSESVHATDAPLETTGAQHDSYAATIHAVKKQTRMTRKARQKAKNGNSTHSEDHETVSIDNSPDESCTNQLDSDSTLAPSSGFACLSISDEE